MYNIKWLNHSDYDIERVEEVVRITIDLLWDDSFKSNLISKLHRLYLASNFKTHNFIDIIGSEFSSQIEIKLKNKNPSRSIFQFINNRSKIDGGIKTFVHFYLILFLLSKGLEYRHDYKISIQLFELLPYSSIENIHYNTRVIGLKQDTFNVILEKDEIPLLNNAMLYFGKSEEDKISNIPVGCPYTKSSSAKMLNKELAKNMLIFLEQLFERFLKDLQLKFKDTSIDDTPMFVNYVLGRFKINEFHLQRYPQFFQRIS